MSWQSESALMNADILNEFGVDVQHIVSGASAAVRVARTDPSELSAGGIEMVLFGDLTQSGFVQVPVKNDVFIVSGTNYRVFDIQGPDESGGLYIHLTK